MSKFDSFIIVGLLFLQSVIGLKMFLSSKQSQAEIEELKETIRQDSIQIVELNNLLEMKCPDQYPVEYLNEEWYTDPDLQN